MNLRRALPILLTLLALVTSCARPGLILTEKGDSEATLRLVGGISPVQNGEATARRQTAEAAGTMRAGLGVALLDNEVEHQGDALVLGHTVLVRSVDPANLGETLRSEKSYRTPFIAGLSPRSVPSARYTMTGGKGGITLEEIYRELSGKHEELIAVVGMGDFQELNGFALAKPPVDGPVGEGPGGDAFTAVTRTKKQPAIFFALILRDTSALSGSRNRLFVVPVEQRTLLNELSLTMAGLVESREGISLSDPGAAATAVTEVCRVDPSSRLRNATLWVYNITEMDSR